MIGTLITVAFGSPLEKVSGLLDLVADLGQVEETEGCSVLLDEMSQRDSVEGQMLITEIEAFLGEGVTLVDQIEVAVFHGLTGTGKVRPNRSTAPRGKITAAFACLRLPAERKNTVGKLLRHAPSGSARHRLPRAAHLPRRLPPPCPKHGLERCSPSSWMTESEAYRLPLPCRRL